MHVIKESIVCLLGSICLIAVLSLMVKGIEVAEEQYVDYSSQLGEFDAHMWELPNGEEFRGRFQKYEQGCIYWKSLSDEGTVCCYLKDLTQRDKEFFNKHYFLSKQASL